MRLIHRTLDRVDVPRVPVPISPDFRLAIVSAVVAIAGVVVNSFGNPRRNAATHLQVLAYAGAFAFLAFGIITVRSVAGEVNRVVGGRTGPGHAGVLRWLILLIGYALVVVSVLDLINVGVIRQIALGAGVTGIVLGIAAQQSLGNLFAGIVLLFARPFNVGDRIRIKSGALGGELIGDVTGMGLTYVTISTTDGPLSLPNSGVLGAGIGPAQDHPDEDAEITAQRAAAAHAAALQAAAQQADRDLLGTSGVEPADGDDGQNRQRMAGFPSGA